MSSKQVNVKSLTVATTLVVTFFAGFQQVALAQDPLTGDGLYKVQVKANGRYWHENGEGDRLVSTRWQPRDRSTNFFFEKQVDGSYRIRAQANGRYLDNGLGDRLVSTRVHHIYGVADWTRFFFEEQADGSYRIRVKSTGRYLHENGWGDRLVSTRVETHDDFTRFWLKRIDEQAIANLLAADTASRLAIGRWQELIISSEVDVAEVSGRVQLVVSYYLAVFEGAVRTLAQRITDLQSDSTALREELNRARVHLASVPFGAFVPSAQLIDAGLVDPPNPITTRDELSWYVEEIEYALEFVGDEIQLAQIDLQDALLSLDEAHGEAPSLSSRLHWEAIRVIR